ncbi:MAG TPA: hypothetical protein VFY57_03740, partial [Rubrobacteraceae bacterium]|nr:hypothetical protein [Rubrobacteraceae bacterium]
MKFLEESTSELEMLQTAIIPDATRWVMISRRRRISLRRAAEIGCQESRFGFVGKELAVRLNS